MIIYYYIMPASSNGVNTATVRPLLRIMIIVITSDRLTFVSSIIRVIIVPSINYLYFSLFSIVILILHPSSTIRAFVQSPELGSI